MKLKCPNLLKPLDTIIQENYEPFNPSEPFRIIRFQMRHPVEKEICIGLLAEKKKEKKVYNYVHLQKFFYTNGEHISYDHPWAKWEWLLNSAGHCNTQNWIMLVLTNLGANYTISCSWNLLFLLLSVLVFGTHF